MRSSTGRSSGELATSIALASSSLPPKTWRKKLCVPTQYGHWFTFDVQAEISSLVCRGRLPWLKTPS